jgi:carbon monoxide dehydrogenase subunit G
MALTLENEFVVEAGLETTWETLLDLPRVAQCLPSASIEPADDDGSYRGRMTVKLGPVSLTYQGTAVLTEVDEAGRVAAFSVKGKEVRGQGTASATVRNSLTAEGDSTRVRVQTELSVTGRPAQFGRGIMQDVAGKILADFASRLSLEIATPAAPETAAAPIAGPGEPQRSEAGVEPGGPPRTPDDVLDLSGAVGAVLAERIRRGLWVGGLLLVVLVLASRRGRSKGARR